MRHLLSTITITVVQNRSFSCIIARPRSPNCSNNQIKRDLAGFKQDQDSVSLRDSCEIYFGQHESIFPDAILRCGIFENEGEVSFDMANSVAANRLTLTSN